MPKRYLLIVSLAFLIGLAAGVSINRYALGTPASIPAPKPSVREQILGRWDAVSIAGKWVIEFGPDNSMTFIYNGGEEQTASIRWFDDEHIEVSNGKEQKRVHVALRDDHLTLDAGNGEILKCKRALTPTDPTK